MNATIALKNIGLNEFGKTVYRGETDGRLVIVEYVVTSYGDRGWRWSVDDWTLEVPVSTKRDAVASLYLNLRAAS